MIFSDKSKIDIYIEQHKRRLSWMPWLFFSLKPKHLEWALPWQREVQQRLQILETIEIEEGCFVAPEAHLFAEPGRKIKIMKGAFVAADVFMHGPLVLGQNSSVNHRSSLDGGSAGIVIGNHTRIGPNCNIYAFDHGMEPQELMRNQNVKSAGIVIGSDVWLGANVCVTDGVVLQDHCVVGMGSVVTQNVPTWEIVGGVPARSLGRRKSHEQHPSSD
jgi:acetyltransferase-like isoleucine patch superfamily enzyme